MLHGWRQHKPAAAGRREDAHPAGTLRDGSIVAASLADDGIDRKRKSSSGRAEVIRLLPPGA
jgi:hypothetical protein